jgi:hypothetical protein
MASSVFHVELRQFPRTARAFNLSREETQRRFIAPWLRRATIELDGQQFTPGRAKLSIYEGRELKTAELGLGRGWQNATRSGEDVTQRELTAATSARVAVEVAIGAADPAMLGSIKDELVAQCALAPVALSQALVLASRAQPAARVSERLAVAERAVWELLHEQRAQLFRAGAQAPIDQIEWGSVLLTWSSWSDSPPAVLLASP